MVTHHPKEERLRPEFEQLVPLKRVLPPGVERRRRLELDVLPLPDRRQHRRPGVRAGGVGVGVGVGRLAHDGVDLPGEQQPVRVGGGGDDCGPGLATSNAQSSLDSELRFRHRMRMCEPSLAAKYRAASQKAHLSSTRRWR